MPSPKVSPIVPGIVKPTVETPFHIDYDWWERQDLQINFELKNHLCDEHQEVFKDEFDTAEIDWVDEETGEVTRVNGLQHVMRVHCSKQPNYINSRLSLIDAIFRVFLANGNKPLTSQELSSIVGAPDEKILRTISGRRVYKGIRPAHA